MKGEVGAGVVFAAHRACRDIAYNACFARAESLLPDVRPNGLQEEKKEWKSVRCRGDSSFDAFRELRSPRRTYVGLRDLQASPALSLPRSPTHQRSLRQAATWHREHAVGPFSR